MEAIQLGSVDGNECCLIGILDKKASAILPEERLLDKYGRNICSADYPPSVIHRISRKLENGNLENVVSECRVAIIQVIDCGFVTLEEFKTLSSLLEKTNEDGELDNSCYISQKN